MKTFCCIRKIATLAVATLLAGFVNGAANLYDGLLTYFPLDENSGRVATDINGATAQFQTLSPHLYAPHWMSGQPGVFLTYNRQQYFRLDDPQVGEGPLQGFTASAWIQFYNNSPMVAWQTIVTKGTTKAPFAFLVHYGADGYYRLALIANAGSPAGAIGGGTWTSANPLPQGVLQHVAVSYDGSHVRFYVNGVADPSVHATSFTFGSVPDEPLYIAADYPGAVEYFNGVLSRIAIYDRALAVDEINQLKDFTFPRLSSSYVGLWVGYAELNEVQEVASGDWSPAPHPLYQKRLLHIDGSGNAHLLSEATLMRTRVSAPDLPEPVVISVPAKVNDYDGIVHRGGQLIGQRFSSASTPMLGNATRLHLGPGDNPAVYDTLSASMELPAQHPLNPFRHKYHPDLRTGFALERTIRFSLPAADSPADNTITGSYFEEFTGLHKQTLRSRGTITFTRASTASSLNP